MTLTLENSIKETSHITNEKLAFGYKISELGMIPEDWETKKLSEISTVVRGGSPRPAGDPRYFNGNYIPWLTVAALTNIPDSKTYVTKTVGYLTKEGSRHSRILEKGTLIIANSGATLGVAKILGIKCCANDGIAALMNQDSGCSRFIAYYLNTKTKYLREVVATGNGQPNLNTTLIGNLKVPFPHFQEQKEIGTILNDIDSLINSLDQLITKKCNIKLAVMQQLLTGKQRLPGFSRDWKMKQLGEITQIVSGGTPKTNIDLYWNGKIKWCTPTDITRSKDKYLFDTERTISSKGLASCSAQLLPIGTLLMCSRATIGDIRIATCEICTNQGFKSLICSKEVYNEFLYYLLQTLKSKIIEKAIGSTFLEISKKDTAALEIILPSHQEQIAIANVLSDMDIEISSLEQQLDKARNLKQGMMQELLTGRIRLK